MNNNGVEYGTGGQWLHRSWLKPDYTATVSDHFYHI